MLLVPIPAEPWRFAGGHVWLDDIVEKSQEDTLQFLDDCASSPIGDSRKVDGKTEDYRKYARRLWDKFCKHVLSKACPGATADPEAIALDLCHNEASAEDKFRAFLRHYVKTSFQLRPALEPVEYQWVREVDSAITVTELWKALVREFDCGFLQKKRQQDTKTTSLYSLKFCDTSRGVGSVWKVSKWIREELAEELDLSRGQLFHKQEVTGEDALAILNVLWARPDLVTCSATDRVAFHLMIPLASIGAFRPGALSCIRYDQVELAVVADPINGSRRLVATITIVHNKTDKNALRRSQNDGISFSVTFAPCPLVCVLSLLVGKAIKDDAFDVGFDSLDALLTRPTLGNSRYLPIHWKKDMRDKPMFELPYKQLWAIWNSCTWALGCRDPPRPYAMRVGGSGRLNGVLTPAVRNFVVNNTSEVFEKSYLPNHFRGQLANFAFGALAGDYKPLFDQLCNASLKVDKDAPMSLSAEEKATFEQRTDLRTICAKLAGDGEGESPGWREELHSRASYIRKCLAKQLKLRKREEYFVRVDRERALGSSCSTSPAEDQTLALQDPQDESCPFQGAMAIGSIFHRFSALLPDTLKPAEAFSKLLDTLKSYSQLLVAYLRYQPAEVAYLAYTAARDAAAPGPGPSSGSLTFADPPLRSRASATTCWCLLGCGSFSRRPGLTRHMKGHIREGSFAKPFECPECRRLGWDATSIEGISHWSAHIDLHHDERDAPNSLSDTRPASGSPIPAASSAKTASCFLCERKFAPKGLYIHYCVHKKDPRWQRPFECPACKRLGQKVIVDNFAAWPQHSDEVHGTSGASLDDEARLKVNKRFQEDADAGAPAQIKRIKGLAGRDSGGCTADGQRVSAKASSSITTFTRQNPAPARVRGGRDSGGWTADGQRGGGYGGGDRAGASVGRSKFALEAHHAGSKANPIVI